MANMGGPVGGGPMPVAMNNGVLAAQQQTQHQNAPNNTRSVLNTYIYEYFLREGMYECARAMLNSEQTINVKDSPGRRNDGGMGSGVGDDPMDTDSKDDLDSKRPADLPAPNVPSSSDSCFLYEWFCLFWDMLMAQRSKPGINGAVSQYINHTQQQNRAKQSQQQEMLRQMRPDMQYNPMLRMPNGMMAAKNQLARTAMANNQNNPQAMHMLQAKQNQMQRDPSDMDGNRRPASPGSAENAPSPSKRPRLDGNTPFNPAQQGMMPNGGQPRPGMPGGQQFNNFNQPQGAQKPSQPSTQAYSQTLIQHHNQQIPNKGMQNPGGPQGQGSPMMPQGPNNAELNQFYNTNDMAGPGGMRAGPGNGNQGGSNHALQDYQMQLMLLEQQNKKRLMMARQEQDSMGSMPRDGPGGPGGAPGPNGNGQPFTDASPQGQRPGASPNPSEQMKRGTPQMNPAGIPSPLPEGAQSRGSPNPMNFMPSNMDPNMGQPPFFKQMNGGMDGSMVQVNGGMRPPSSHPNQPFNGQMNSQQMMVARQQAAQAGQGGPQMQWQGGPNGANPMVPQGGPQGGPGVQGTPQQRSMPPPSAPAPGNPNARTQPSSPAQSTAAPPTPQQSNKAAPKKKDTKAAKSKAAQKKPNTNTGATPAADQNQEPEQQTPATPITPVNPAAFNKNGQNAAPSQPVPNAQPSAPPVPVPVAPQVPADPTHGFNMDNPTLDFGGLEFTNPSMTGDVLQDFDFDSFLHDGDGDGGPFDFNPSSFDMQGTGEIGAD